MSGRRPVLVIVGTRPEAIMPAPLIDAFAALRRLVARIRVIGRHREMLDQLLEEFAARSPFGDGAAAPRIAAHLEAALA